MPVVPSKADSHGVAECEKGLRHPLGIRFYWRARFVTFRTRPARVVGTVRNGLIAICCKGRVARLAHRVQRVSASLDANEVAHWKTPLPETRE